ncbi:hypothetical protein [Piscinibacter sp.]|jgi:hypothetical protein|uniref:hypothetical protein n=1 Tax=Piscinibacter sp. TaxID=1903157 RepID=UPI00355A46BD
MKTHIMIALFASVALLSACGGGSDTSPPPAPGPTDAVPDSASASAAGLKGYLSDLGAMQVETKEPVGLDTFSPKMDEDTEPEPVA